MKISLISSTLLLITGLVYSQDVGIGTKEPTNKLEVLGNLVVNSPFTKTSTPPTPAQTKTMINNQTLTYQYLIDSTGRFFDPGGPGGNYVSNLNAYVELVNNAIGIEIIIESIGLASGDSIIIKDWGNERTLLSIGNGYTTPGRWVFQGPELLVQFKSNGDNINGIGFSILFRYLYPASGTQSDIAGFVGSCLYFDTKKGAFRAGIPINAPIGINSTALGSYTEASGEYSFAAGLDSKASGSKSTSIGRSTIASGESSTAIGWQTNASGFASFAAVSQSLASGQNSIAMGYGAEATGYGSFSTGYETFASGDNSTALGFENVADGNNSTVMGIYNETYGDYSTAIGSRMLIPNYAVGAFALGDYESSSDPLQQTLIGAANTFTSRFRNGYYLLTSQNAPGGLYTNRTGVTCAGGQNSWSAWSDVNRKENFLPVDGEYFLNKIAAMPQYTWNYKAQSPKEFRHYGPMAQDIFNAFGTDELGVIGNDTMINQQDLLGIEFIGIQALEKRTSDLQIQLNTVLKILESCQKQIAILEEKNNKLTAAAHDSQK